MGRKAAMITSARSRYYKSANSDKKRAKWNAPNTSPNTALSSDLEKIRNRSLAGQRNSSFLKSAISNLVSYEVGTGIVPRAISDNKEFNKLIDELWEYFVDYCDTSGVLSFYGNQALAARCRRVSGEVFIRLRTVSVEDITEVPLRIELLEPDYCPIGLNQIAPNGNEIKSGVEFTKKGKRVAYWFYKSHPSDTTISLIHNGNQYIRIPAKNIIHHYMPLRPQQIRGEPDSAQALLKTYTLENYDQAELERKESRAPFTGFLERQALTEEDWDYDPLTGELLSDNSAGQIGMDVEAGTLIQGLPGESLTLFDGDKGNEAYADYIRQQALQIAAGHGVPHPIMTGDYKDVNDRTIRVDLNNFYRKIDAEAAHIMVFQVCRQIRNRFIDLSIMTGLITAKDFATRKRNYQKTDWIPQPRAYIHPVQDIDATIKAIDNNLESEEDYLRSRGKNPDNVIEQRAEFQKKVVESMPINKFTLISPSESSNEDDEIDEDEDQNSPKNNEDK